MLKACSVTSARILFKPKAMSGSCMTPIFQSSTLRMFKFGRFCLVAKLSMLPCTAMTGASCSSSSITVNSTKSPAWMM